MYLPILHHTGTGLFVGTDRIVLFKLMRFRDSVRTVTLQDVPLGEEVLENALESVAKRCSPSNLYVVSNLDTATVKHVLLEGPAFENYTDRSLWIQRQINSVLPGSEPNDLFCAQHVVLLTDTNRTRVLAGIVRAEVVEARSQLLQTAGFRPIGLSTLPSVFPAAFMLDSDIVEGTSRLAWMSPDDGFRISLTAGYMSDLEYPLSRDPNEDGPPESMIIPNGLADRGGLLQKHTIPAAAMAMSRLYPGLEHLDFLDESTKTLNQGKFEKERALRFMGSVFGALFALLLVLLAVEWHLSRLQLRTQSELHAIAAPWRAMERRVHAVEELRSRLRETSTVVESRTGITRILDTVGRAVPEGLWLTSLHITSTTVEAYDVTLEGATRDDLLIPRLLDNLRIEPSIETAELAYSRRGTTASSFEVNARVNMQRIQ